MCRFPAAYARARISRPRLVVPAPPSAAAMAAHTEARPALAPHCARLSAMATALSPAASTSDSLAHTSSSACTQPPWPLHAAHMSAVRPHRSRQSTTRAPRAFSALARALSPSAHSASSRLRTRAWPARAATQTQLAPSLSVAASAFAPRCSTSASTHAMQPPREAACSTPVRTPGVGARAISTRTHCTRPRDAAQTNGSARALSAVSRCVLACACAPTKPAMHRARTAHAQPARHASHSSSRSRDSPKSATPATSTPPSSVPPWSLSLPLAHSSAGSPSPSWVLQSLAGLKCAVRWRAKSLTLGRRNSSAGPSAPISSPKAPPSLTGAPTRSSASSESRAHAAMCAPSPCSAQSSGSRRWHTRSAARESPPRARRLT
mmetsp:Transcript_10004/g.41466  ORF Transcript_10004/g.41466 Transcript_10004/m.41466 type:complete len:378 (-) Transcript_10004:2173-3306(-)